MKRSVKFLSTVLALLLNFFVLPTSPAGENSLEAVRDADGEYRAPFTAPLLDRPFLCEGTVPFPAPEQFDRETARKIVDEFGIEQIVFVKRATFQSSHYYTDFIDGSRFFGTDLSILDLKSGKITDLLPDWMKKGIVNRFDISFDAQRIVFDWKADAQSGFHLWEISVDGTGLTQLTFPPEDEAQTVEKFRLYTRPTHWVRDPETYPVKFGIYQRWSDDMHPAYLPDGDIVFISTRCRHGILCDGSDVLSATVLFRLDRETGKMEKLTNSSVSEANPIVTEDGRIVYTRWEYVDKGGSCVKCLWSMNQDGTGSAEVFGNDIAMPPSIIHPRQIPGKPNLFIATGAPHCPNTGIGTILRIDTQKNIRTPEAMEILTPETRSLGEGDYLHPLTPPEDAEKIEKLHKRGPCFCDPYPLDETRLLMSAMLDPRAFFYRPDGYGLYLFNGPSDYALLYRSAGTSCWNAQPLRPRTVPPVRVSPRDETLVSQTLHGQPLAVCAVMDVYAGMENVQRGEVRYLRINEQVPRPWSARRVWGEDFRNHPGGDDYDQQHATVSGTHLGLKVQWGIVPVEEDGSAYFYVPADRNIFFQALDENFRELQRERTYVNYRPGETRACIGCHETPKEAVRFTDPRNGRILPKALTRSPSMPGPQPGEETGARTLDFVRDIQPILDGKCIACHDGDETRIVEGKTNRLDLRGIPTPFFTRSYENLLGFRCSRDLSYPVLERPAESSLVGKVIREIHPKVGNAEYLPAKSLGSTTAPLVKRLENGHYGTNLTQEEMVRLTTWIDSNCQFYGTYWGAKNLRFRELPNFRPNVTFEEAIQREVPERLRFQTRSVPSPLDQTP
ncbi:MAG: hypothetical protein E7029_04140 [Planctomycetaceae bacterium]|nr:hypothetical protein [Planctomycetaceae bacterium]